MPQVNIPDALFKEVQQSLPTAVSPDDFVVMAVREKLTSEGQKKEFFKLSDQTRSAMQRLGLTEADVMKEFEATRHSQNG